MLFFIIIYSQNDKIIKKRFLSILMIKYNEIRLVYARSSHMFVHVA